MTELYHFFSFPKRHSFLLSLTKLPSFICKLLEGALLKDNYEPLYFKTCSYTKHFSLEVELQGRFFSVWHRIFQEVFSEGGKLPGIAGRPSAPSVEIGTQQVSNTTK